MSMSRFLRISLVCVVLAAMLSFVLELAVLKVRPCAAQTPEENIELKWDDGIAMNRVSSGVGGCPSCYTFQGVEFSLPEGLSTAVLKMVRVYAGDGKSTLAVYVTDAAGESLMQPVGFQVNGTAWYDIPLQNVVVPAGFNVWIETPKGNFFKATEAEPFYDSKPTGHSFYNDNPTEYRHAVPGDFLIRAVILPEVHVGPGQDYKTIQEAVDSVWDGWTVVVHDGTYNENVTVNKGVTIRSLSGPAKTVVQTPFADRNVFTVTANGVKLSGFTIQGAGDPSSGISIEGSSGCTISGNVIQDSYYGIYVSEDSTNNILLENECKFNSNGIYVDGSQNYISGNKLHGNTAPLGSAVFLSGTASGNVLRFNSITIDAGMEPAVANGPQVYNQNSTAEASAIENWWGSESGPANMTMVLSDPCLTKPPVRVKTAFTSAGEFTVDAQSETSTTVIKQGDGTPVVSVASFAENPAGDFKGKSLGKWVDVLFSSSDSIDQVEIRVSYTPAEIEGLKEGSLKLFWWNGQKWMVCSKTNVDKAGGFVWARLDAKSKPGPGDLGGTMFAVGISNGSSGFQWWVIPLVILIVILLLIVFRLVWVLLIKGERM